MMKLTESTLVRDISITWPEDLRNMIIDYSHVDHYLLWMKFHLGALKLVHDLKLSLELSSFIHYTQDDSLILYFQTKPVRFDAKDLVFMTVNESIY